MRKIVGHRTLCICTMSFVLISSGDAIFPFLLGFLRFVFAFNKCGWHEFTLLAGMLIGIGLTCWSCAKSPGRIQWGCAIAVFCAVIAGASVWWGDPDRFFLPTIAPFLLSSIASLCKSYEKSA